MRHRIVECVDAAYPRARRALLLFGHAFFSRYVLAQVDGECKVVDRRRLFPDPMNGVCAAELFEIVAVAVYDDVFAVEGYGRGY